jgi:23S rRNA (guanosine2251-2'-O)-methyltransferase
MQKNKFNKQPGHNKQFIDNDQRVIGIHAVKATLMHMPGRAVKLHVTESSSRLDELVTLAKKTFSERFGDDVAHQSAVLLAKPFPYVDFYKFLEQTPLQLCLVLDGIEDPRNLGRAARSAFALGAQLLIISKDRSAQITATAEKAAVGTLAQLPVAHVTNLSQTFEALKKAGIWVIGAAGEATLPAWKCDLTKPCALAIGSEESGLKKLVREQCDELIYVPMTTPDLSLNAADAVTVLMYEASRQRNAMS